MRWGKRPAVGRQRTAVPKNPALQQLRNSSKSAFTTPQRPIRNTFGTVAVRDFSENGCINCRPRREVVGCLWHVKLASQKGFRIKQTVADHFS